MKSVNLLSNLKGESTLDGFAKKFFQAIGTSTFEERESSNYIDGRYFRGAIDKIAFTVSLSDEQDHEDLKYWIYVASDALDENALVSEIDRMVNASLLPTGFQVARMVNFGKRSEQRLDY